MKEINLDYAEHQLLLKVVAGSHAYGLNDMNSDIDIRGIFLLPNEYRLGNGYIEQIADDKNDLVYYELNRFINLLAINNPNIIEILFTSKENVLHFDERIRPLYDNREKFLTKKLLNSFGAYSLSQIKKARGLNKKIVNPVAKERKSPLDFCYIFEKDDGYMMLAKQWLKKHNKKQEHIGLSELPNGIQLYKVHYDYLADIKNDNPRYSGIAPHGFKGIVSENGNDIRHSEIPKNYTVDAFLYFNKNGYSLYCKEYKEYWEWVEKRNPHRYNDNISHNQNYDGKNLSHCVRLLEMAIEIGNGDGVNLLRPNRDFLLQIKKGLLTYEEVMKYVREKEEEMGDVFNKTKLPDDIDPKFVNDIILEIRNK